MSFNFRYSCLWIHRYTGLAMAVFLIITGITGTLLTFHDKLDDIFKHKLTQVEKQNASHLPIAELTDKVISAHPPQNFSSMSSPKDSARSA